MDAGAGGDDGDRAAGLAATALVDVTATGNAIQPARRGVIEEYLRIDTTFDPAALDRVSTWLAAHTGR